MSNCGVASLGCQGADRHGFGEVLMRKVLAFSVGAIFLGTIAAVPARATTFDFSVASIGALNDVASGTFTASQISSGVYQVTGITGTFNGAAITQLSGYANADNELFFSAQSYVDFQGISFLTSLGAVNLFSNSGYFEVKSVVDPVGYYFNGTPISLNVGASNVSATPLPDGLPLFATGLALIGMTAWWRKRKAQGQTA
jgi:hypothetical protein